MQLEALKCKKYSQTMTRLAVFFLEHYTPIFYLIQENDWTHAERVPSL